jgi:hypothetical protein
MLAIAVDPDQRANRGRFLLRYSELENVLANPRRARQAALPKLRQKEELRMNQMGWCGLRELGTSRRACGYQVIASAGRSMEGFER